MALPHLEADYLSNHELLGQIGKARPVALPHLDADSLSDERLDQVGVVSGAKVHTGGKAGLGYGNLLPTLHKGQRVEGDDGILRTKVSPLQCLVVSRRGQACGDRQRIHQL